MNQSQYVQKNTQAPGQWTSPVMDERDLVYGILCELKRVSGEYATAMMESSCNTVRQMFHSLLNDSLQIQTDIFHLMSQQNWYGPSSPALRQDIDKQIAQSQQTHQKTQQWVQQQRSNPGSSWQTNVTNQPNWQSQTSVQ